jgi:hypothetical protein
MGFNRRKIEDRRRQAAEKEAAARRATDTQVVEDAERLIGAWNERQGKRMPMLFSPTIGAAIAVRHWFLWVRCRRAERSMRLTCGLSIVTATRRCRALFLRCPAGRAVQMRRLPSWCAYRERASRTKCARSIGGGCLANELCGAGLAQDSPPR